MGRRTVSALLVAVLGLWASFASTPATAGDADLTGLWCGTAQQDMQDMAEYGPTFPFRMDIVKYGTYHYALTYLPELGLLDSPLPAMVDGHSIFIYIPSTLIISGAFTGDSLTGWAVVYTDSDDILFYDWQASRYTGAPVLPGPGPGPSCDLPPLFCTGSAQHSSELVQFDPVEGPGYLDYPANGETSDNQYRSYLRRDLRQIIDYATAKVAGKTADWDYGNHAPLGLLDMSEADGSTPGTSIGHPAHPAGTHEDGKDIDTAYYQLYAADNLGRAIGDHHEGYWDVWHLVGEPYALDTWRTGLYLAYLSEHPRMRVIGVDGQAGLVLEEALDELVIEGWISSELRARIPLAYEVTNQGQGWYFFHHHHLHISLSPLHDIVSDFDLKPETLNKRSKGKYITGYIELDADHDPSDIAITSVALIVNGHMLVYAEPQHSRVSDYNKNGIPDLMVKFDRKLVTASAGTGTVEMAVTGLADGKFFQASDTVRVISPGRRGGKGPKGVGASF